MVGDIAHRIDGFLCWPGGDNHSLPGQCAIFQMLNQMLQNIERIKHAARPNITTGLIAIIRAKQLNATLDKSIAVLLGGTVEPHTLIHSRC